MLEYMKSEISFPGAWHHMEGKRMTEILVLTWWIVSNQKKGNLLFSC